MKSQLRVNQMWLDQEDVGASNWATRRPVVWRLAQVNHYAVRSKDALALKKRRGRGWEIKPADGSNDRHNDEFIKVYDRNDAVDTSILKHLAATDKEIARLMALPSVAELHAAGIEAAEKLLAADTPVARPDVGLSSKAQDLLETALSSSKAYLEYGCGGTTVLAAESNGPVVFSVDSRSERLLEVRQYLATRNDAKAPVHTHTAFVGDVDKSGRPKSDRLWRHFARYPFAVWSASDFEEPDLVLLNGPFRTACFLACYIKHQKPLRVLFNGYGSHYGYRSVERVAAPTGHVDEMAIFDLDPSAKDCAAAMDLIDTIGDPT